MDKPDYMKQYYDWINEHKVSKADAQSNGYDCHHVIPKSIGGSNDKSNIVHLTIADHIKAHELLFKAAFQQAVALAHAVVSIAGKDQCSGEAIALDKLDERSIKIETARNLMAKRTVYDAKTLKPVKIPFYSSTPDGCIEKAEGRKTHAFNAQSGATAYWPKSALPCGWTAYADATDEERMKYFPKIAANAKKQKQRQKRAHVPMHWIQCPELKTSKLVPKADPVPEGWKLGMYYTESMLAKVTAAGMMQKARLEAISNGGYRWIHDMRTHKNKLIGKKDPLPAGFAEGQFNKKVWELEQQLAAMQKNS